jgi:hypothetical protein
MDLTWVKLKLGSKDPLLVRVWHSIELILIQHCMLGVDYLWPYWRVLLSFTCSGFALMLFCRCVSLSLSAWAILEVGILRVRCHSRSSSVHFRKCFYFFTFRLKLCNRIQNSICNKVWLLEHFICLNRVCDVLCVITSVMTPHNDPS